MVVENSEIVYNDGIKKLFLYCYNEGHEEGLKEGIKEGRIRFINACRQLGADK